MLLISKNNFVIHNYDTRFKSKKINWIHFKINSEKIANLFKFYLNYLFYIAQNCTIKYLSFFFFVRIFDSLFFLIFKNCLKKY